MVPIPNTSLNTSMFTGLKKSGRRLEEAKKKCKYNGLRAATREWNFARTQKEISSFNKIILMRSIWNLNLGRGALQKEVTKDWKEIGFGGDGFRKRYGLFGIR